MKSINMKLRLLAMSFMMFLFSCTDIDQFIDRIEPSLITVDRNVLWPAWEKTLGTKDTIQFMAWSGITHAFEDHSRIIFEPKSFYLDGQPLPNKVVTLVIIRAYKKNQMVRNLISTNSEKAVLESAGMMHVEAFCDGKPLTLAPGKNYTIQIPVKDASLVNPNMEMFYGEETRFGINWVEADQNPSIADNVFVTEWQIRDSSGGGFVVGIECFPERLNWVNCDYFLKFENRDKTEPCIEIEASGANDKITVSTFCVFHDLNVVIAPCCEASNAKVCFSSLPIGEKVTYIVLGKGKTDYYLGHFSSEIYKDEVVKIDIKSISLDDLKYFLSKL
ncbi:MAG: hypothetical protein IPH93_12400 [Saprospiraceae bacterium]|nr:hypothetical protein [Saprospiraceae bacterium]MBK7812745.1 hypothetical protein [Saprospiraceae bacterium]